MAGIWNVNSIYNSNMKKVSSKLTFQLGETFSARVISLNGDKNEGVLKLLDGWQFPAKVEQPLDFGTGELLKFQVVGFEDGKLKIKLVSTSSDKENSEDKSIDDILTENNIDIEEYGILEKMIKHNMPLTKENISKIKSLNDFLKKLSKGTAGEEDFINKYLESKNISVNTDQSKEVKELLKGFFKEFRKISLDDLLTLVENNIELNAENIESFNKVFKGSMEIYKSSEALGEGLKNLNKEFGLATESPVIGSDWINALGNNEDNTNLSMQDTSFSIPYKGIVGSASNYSQNIDSKKMKSSSIMDLLKAASKENYELKNIIKEIIINNKQNTNEEDVNNQLKGLEKFTDEKILDTLDWVMSSRKDSLGSNPGNFIGTENKLPSKEDAQELIKVIFGDSVSISDNDFEDLLNTIRKMTIKDNSGTPVNGSLEKIIDKNTSDIVKEQIRIKTDEIKNTIKDIITKGNYTESEIYTKVIDLVKNSVNDFKVFNAVSNGYYYMDLPISLKDNEYPCKLIIKDDRSKGKKIDSKNVKLVVSVKTLNMGTIDGYIKVKDMNMAIEIKSEDKWVKVLEIAKEKLLNNFRDSGYNIKFTVSKREVEVNITNCRDFFEDFGLSNIDIKV